MKRFKIEVDEGFLSCVLSEGAQSESTGSLVGTLDAALGVLVLVHPSPIGNCECTPLPQMASALKCATLRFDLSGCGESSGNPTVGAYERDAKDIREIVVHVRQTLQREVLGLLGFAEGGTAVLRYAARYHDVPNIITISARSTPNSSWFERCLTWAQVKQLNDTGTVDWCFVEPRGRKITLSVRKDEVTAWPDLGGLQSCDSTHFLVLHGSLDEQVAVSDAHALEGMLVGSASCELRIIPGVGSDWTPHQSTLSYAVSDWLWRKTRPTSSLVGFGTETAEMAPGAGLAQALEHRPSGFNIFVDNLSLQVKEIHAEARQKLPSMAMGDDDEGDVDESPLPSRSTSRLGL